MGVRLREKLDHQNTGQDHQNADHRRQIQPLAEDDHADARDKDDAQPRPNGIGDADGDLAEGQAQKVEGETVAQNDQSTEGPSRVNCWLA